MATCHTILYSKLCKEFCKENFNIKLLFTSILHFLVYNFFSASCSSTYIGETCRHFETKIKDHIKKGNKSHIYKYLHTTATCFDS